MPFGLSITPFVPSYFRRTCLPPFGLRHLRWPPTSSTTALPKQFSPSPHTSTYIADLPPFITSTCLGACATPISPPQLITSRAHDRLHVSFLATHPPTKDIVAMTLPHTTSSSPVKWSLMKLCFHSLSTIPHLPMNPMISYLTSSPHTRHHLRSIGPVAPFVPHQLP